jgi:4-amino-4-deoxy-L-arabinose transferase-like glycosyltransferase
MQRVGEVATADRPAAGAFALPAALVRTHWPALLATAATIILGIPTLNYPYGPDQALFAYIGEHLLRGDGLYVDVWDVKPPGIFWIYAAIDLLPGAPFRVLRGVDLLYTVASVVAIYALATLYWDRLAGAVAGGLYGAVYIVATGYWHSAQPDSFMVLPLVLALLAYELARRRGNTTAALLSGLLFGFAIQLRPTVVLVAGVLMLLDLRGSLASGGLRHWRRDPAAHRALALAAGGIAIEVIALLWLALHGAVGEYLYAQLDFAPQYARQGGPYSPEGLNAADYLSGLRSGTMFIVFARLILVAPAVAAVVIGFIRRDRPALEMGVLTLAAYAGVAIQAKYFLYHWHLVLPFLALLSGYTATSLWRTLRDSGRGPVVSGVILAGVGGLLLLFTPNVTDRAVREWSGFIYWLQPENRETYYNRFGLYGRGSFSFRASDDVAIYLREATRPGDTIFIWGYDPLLYVAADRESPSRFTSFLPLMSEWTPPEWVDAFVDDLEQQKPTYIILQRNENAPWITGHWIDPVDFVPLLPRFKALLDRDYELDRTIEDYTLYRRHT